jgi:hypothetical protein
MKVLVDVERDERMLGRNNWIIIPNSSDTWI